MKKKSSVSLILIIIVFIIVFLIIDYSKIKNNNLNKQDGSEYTGTIIAQNDINKNKVLITIPKGYSDTGGKHNYYISTKGEKTKFVRTCRIQIYHVGNYKNADHLSKKLASYHKTKREDVLINKTKWYYVQFDSTIKTGYYLTDHDKKILLVKIEGTNDECFNELTKTIRKTLKLK